jgi:hypothetical protein
MIRTRENGPQQPRERLLLKNLGKMCNGALVKRTGNAGIIGKPHKPQRLLKGACLPKPVQYVAPSRRL